MIRKNQILVFSALFLIFTITLFAQEQTQPPTQKELLYRSALKHYVDKLITRLSTSSLGQERFLVQQIRMLNDEIRARVSGIENYRKSYFELLQQRLSEVKALKRRLKRYNSARLNEFLDRVENTINETLALGKVDFQRQKAIEDAIQLLYVAEEMIKMDPNAKIENDREFTQDLQKTEQKLTKKSIATLGYEDYKSTPSVKKRVTVYDFYKEWELNERVNYELRWTDVLIIKKRLLKEGSALERERMFKRELRQAAEAFNFGLYDLAERSFEEILNRYTFIGKLDDCRYYKGLSNFLLERYPAARKDFELLVRDYPNSTFVPLAFKFLIQIENEFENYDKVIDYYNQFVQTGVQGSQIYDEVTFMASVAALKAKKYDVALGYLNRIGRNSVYYPQALYLSSEAYVGVGNFVEAERILKDLAFNYHLSPDFHDKVLLKLGLLEYELGNYRNAINFFDMISQNFSQYDRVLLGYAWSYFKLEMNKPSLQDRDFSQARQYLELLIDTFYGSDYLLEARTLLAYIYQQQNQIDAALRNYRYVFEARDVKELSDEINEETRVLGQYIDLAKKIEERGLAKENPELFTRAYKLRTKLYKPYLRFRYLDLSSSGFAVQSEMERLEAQLKELQKLKDLAKERQRKDLVKKIERMELKIYQAMNSLRIERSPQVLGVNYFDVHPLARKESVIEYRNKEILKMRQELRKQKQEIVKRLSQLDIQINQAQKEKNYRKLVALELSKERFQDLLKKIDFLETQSYTSDLMQSTINLNKWSDFGAFGLTNVKFNVKTMTTKQIEDMQKKIEAINKFLQLRRQNIEHKIRQINDAIVVMTRKVRQQERLRKREELMKQFEESYFDTHDTEIQYEETPEVQQKSTETKTQQQNQQ